MRSPILLTLCSVARLTVHHANPECDDKGSVRYHHQRGSNDVVDTLLLVRGAESTRDLYGLVALEHAGCKPPLICQSSQLVALAFLNPQKWCIYLT